MHINKCQNYKQMKFKNLKKGEVLSEVQMWTVDKMVGNKAKLINEKGDAVDVSDEYVENCLTSGEQYDSEVAISKTELAEKFRTSVNTAITVNFTKQLKEDEVAEVIKKNLGLTPKKLAQAVLAGEERTLTGRLHSTELDDLGYMRVIDLKIPKPTTGYDNRLRNINPRNINWMIVNGVKYKAK